MRKLVLTFALVLPLAVANLASATTWYVGYVLYGNICRSGYFYTVYPTTMGQPVGSQCPVNNSYGQFMTMGNVANE